MFSLNIIHYKGKQPVSTEVDTDVGICIFILINNIPKGSSYLS